MAKLVLLTIRLLVSLGLLASLPPAAADVVKPALVEISVYDDGRLAVEIRASIEALLTGINGQYQNTTEAPTADEYDRLRVLEAEDLQQAFDPFRERMLEAIELRLDDAKANLRISSTDIPVPGYTKVPRISLIVLEGEVPQGSRALTWYYPSAFGDNAVRVRQIDEIQEKWHWSAWQWIREDRTSDAFSLTEVFSPPGPLDIAKEYAQAGFDHIVPRGADHILFVIGLFLLSTQVKPLLWQVTMFTVAHSITLGLAMAGILTLPASVVEPLIALSIAYIGIENIWHRRLHNSRLLLVFGFGLLHGLGFASMLSDFGMPEDAFLTALISFNIGVELGQLAVLAIAYLTVGFWFGKKDFYRNVIVIPGSLLISVVGLMWTWQRLSF